MIKGKKRKIIESFNIDVNIHNRFDVEVRDSITGELKQTAKAENVILNQFWVGFLGNPNSEHNNYIAFGTGSGTPSSSDTGLFAYAGSYSCSRVSDDKSIPGVYSVTKKIVLTETMNNGVTITELGIANGTGNTKVETHAMLTDMNGNQISITKTNTDIITIYSTIFLHYPLTLSNGISLTSRGSVCTAYEQSEYCHGFFVWVLHGKALGSYSYGSAQDFTNAIVMDSTFVSGTLPMSMGLTPTYDSANRRVTYTAARVGYSSFNTTSKNKTVIALATKNVPEKTSIFIPVESIFPGGISITGEAIGTGDGLTTDFKTCFPLISDSVIYVDGVECNTCFTDAGVPFIEGLDAARRIHYILDYYRDVNGVKELWPAINTSNYSTNPFEHIVRNRYVGKVLITGMTLGNASNELYGSSNGTTWERITTPGSLTSEQQAYEWYKIKKITNAYAYALTGITISRTSDKNIHFTTPPASGAVITADYHTHTIAKDENHVFDFSCVIQFGEYTPT